MLQTTESNERDQDLPMKLGLVVRFWARFHDKDSCHLLLSFTVGLRSVGRTP